MLIILENYKKSDPYIISTISTAKRGTKIIKATYHFLVFYCDLNYFPFAFQSVLFGIIRINKPKNHFQAVILKMSRLKLEILTIL